MGYSHITKFCKMDKRYPQSVVTKLQSYL